MYQRHLQSNSRHEMPSKMAVALIIGCVELTFLGNIEPHCGAQFVQIILHI